MSAFTECTVEDAALAWLEDIGWRVAHGPYIAPDVPGAERADYGDVVFSRLLRDALARRNPNLPAEAVDDAFRKLTRSEGADPAQRNRALHRLLLALAIGQHERGLAKAADGLVGTMHLPDHDWIRGREEDSA